MAVEKKEVQSSAHKKNSRVVTRETNKQPLRPQRQTGRLNWAANSDTLEAISQTEAENSKDSFECKIFRLLLQAILAMYRRPSR